MTENPHSLPWRMSGQGGKSRLKCIRDCYAHLVAADITERDALFILAAVNPQQKGTAMKTPTTPTSAEMIAIQMELDRLALADDVAMKARGERHDG